MAPFKIHVRDLPKYTTVDELALLFSRFGRVIQCERRNSYGFVYMENEEQGKTAISTLNESQFKGNTIRVSEATRTQTGPVKDYQSYDFVPYKIHVRDLPKYTSVVELAQLFSSYGLVVECERRNNYGFVYMENEAQGKNAIEALNGKDYKGSILKVSQSISPLTTGTDWASPCPPPQSVSTAFKIHVRDLPKNTTIEELRNLFIPFGRVIDCERKNCYGFVYMENESQGLVAINALNNRPFNGSILKVNVSIQNDGQSTDLVVDSDKVSTFKLHVRNLPYDTSMEELKGLFEAYGRVVEIEGKNNYGFVHMEDEMEAKVAMEALNQREYRGSTLVVSESRTQVPGPSIPSTRLKVSNLPPSLSARTIRHIFKKYSKILSVEVRCGEAIVVLDASGNISGAIAEVNGLTYEGSSLLVETIVNTNISFTPRASPRPLLPPAAFPPPSYPNIPSLLTPQMVPRPRPLLPCFPKPQIPQSRRNEAMPQRPWFSGQRGMHRARLPPRPHRTSAPDLGQAFSAPPMIAPGIFKPPKKFYSDKPKPKRKKKPGPKPDICLPIPLDPPCRPVPEQSQLIPQMPSGAYLKAFPPPAANQLNTYDGTPDYSQDNYSFNQFFG